MPNSAVTSVLVVGCGYIGLPFARLAIAQGSRVFATTRRRERFSALAAEGLEPVRWDVVGDENDSLPEVDAVVFAVGYDRSAGRTIDEVYVQGVSNTLSALPGSPKVVYASSTGVYGDADGAWIDESAPAKPSDPSSHACSLAENELKEHCEQRGFEFSILRFAGLYGPGRLIGGDAMKRGEPVSGDGEHWLNLVHQEDAALALWQAVRLGVSGETYNIADGSPVQRKDFYAKLAELLNCPPPTFAPELARRHRGNRRINPDKAKRELRWTPRYPSYVEGLDSIVR